MISDKTLAELGVVKSEAGVFIHERFLFSQASLIGIKPRRIL